MAGSKQLVYLPSIRKNTWLLMSKRVGTVHLRDYSKGDVEIIRKMTTVQADELLKRSDAFVERVAIFNRVRVDSVQFWIEQIRFRNLELDGAQTKKEHRIQDEFKRQCKPHLEHGRVQELRGIFHEWTERFALVNDKDQFNHWDNDDASINFGSTKIGVRWSSYLLENSRQGGGIRWIPTGNSLTDFSLAAMELNLGISSKRNRFNPGRIDSIEPDGLGIRPNGFMTVFEIKGPDDERDLIDPLLQATCGALAVLAKKEMICNVARTAGDRRPAYTNARIPKTRRSIGLHIATAEKNMRGKNRLPAWSDVIEQQCHTVLEAGKQFEYIAYSFVEPNAAGPFSELPVDRVVTHN